MYKCPQCFFKFRKQDALFRCASIAQICAHSEDEIYHQFHDDERRLQGRVLGLQASSHNHFFNKTWNTLKDSFSCDACATVTHQRLCPQCHHNLPPVFFDSEMIALGFICQRAQELEAYVAYLKKVLEKTLAYDLQYVLRPELSSTKFDLYLEKSSFKAKKSFLNFNKRPDVLQVRFYPLTLGLSNPSVESFEGIFILCDKMNAAEGRPYVPESIQNLILSTQQDMSSGVVHARNRKISVPVALIYSCFENLTPLIPSSHPLFRQGDHGTGYNQEEGARISSEMLAFTGYWFGSNTLQLIKRYFLRYRLFCQSFSYPESQPFLAHSGWRIEDPFLWVLYCLGKIKGVSKKRG